MQQHHPVIQGVLKQHRPSPVMPRALFPGSVEQAIRKPARLWNAKRRIESSRGLGVKELKKLERDHFWRGWESLVSKDVVEFVDSIEGRDSTGQPIREMLPEEKLKLLKAPALYFSRPYNVPAELRRQVYFPETSVTLLRTPHLGPFFAQFMVPLSFGKLDLKSYLKNLYDVDVHHIRSFVIHQKPENEKPIHKYQKGTLVYRAYKKKMTVQLVEPFVWPAELSKETLNGADYERKRYWDSMKRTYDAQVTFSNDFLSKPDKKHRITIAEQAKALLEGKAKWQPTWKSVGPTVRAIEGLPNRPLPPRTQSEVTSMSP